MRKVILGLVAASAAFTAVPASAQPWRLSPAVNREIQQDINQLDRRIDRAAARGTISRREAQSLRLNSRNLQRNYRYFARNGLDRREVRELQDQINGVYNRLRMERRDWDGRRG